MSDDVAQEKEDLLDAMKGKKGEAAYDQYAAVISSLECVCRNGALKMVKDSKASSDRKKSAANYINQLYNEHIKTYPPQQRQAILDGQDYGPITQNAAIAIDALCGAMLKTAEPLY